MSDFIGLLRASGVVAIVRRPALAVDEALAVVDGLVTAGLGVVEFTLNTPGALEAIEAVARRHDVAVGAGTVLTPHDVDGAADAGAAFVVAPDTDVAVIAQARARGLACMPGAFTATEIRHAMEAGASAAKVFPAGPVGPAYVAALLGPFPGTPLVPTGGIGIGDVVGFLEAGALAVGIGGTLTDDLVRLPEIAQSLAAEVRRAQTAEP